jgi:5'-nucleotidase
MRILICNDDGIDAPGLRLLARAAQGLSADVWVVAPERKWTAASHQLSFDRDLTLIRSRERTYACSGAPADCVVAAMSVLFADAPKPALVLAGVNDKRNVAQDLAYSGTMAIAREAAFFGVPAIALSRADHAREEAADVDALRDLLRLLWRRRTDWTGEGHWLGLNLPVSLPAPLVQARIGRDKIGGSSEILRASAERIDYRLQRGRPGTTTPGDENACLAEGSISIVRYCWFMQAPLPASTLAAWQDAAG